jgi:hypothetical protein
MNIEEIPGVDFEKGKQGIKGEHKSKINGDIKLSLDFDAAFNRGNDNAWDYLLQVGENYPLVEIHPAKSGGNLNEMVAKLKWLKGWILTHEKADLIKKEKSRLIWLYTSGFDIQETPQGKRRRILAQHKIQFPPQRDVNLDKVEYFTFHQIFNN